MSAKLECVYGLRFLDKVDDDWLAHFLICKYYDRRGPMKSFGVSFEIFAWTFSTEKDANTAGHMSTYAFARTYFLTGRDVLMNLYSEMERLEQYALKKEKERAPSPVRSVRKRRVRKNKV